jgi:prepilin-type N-terminal cleavage/methylation domain-containing protein
MSTLMTWLKNKVLHKCSNDIRSNNIPDSGFSLVELIASLTIAGILAVALMTIVVTALNGFSLSKRAAGVTQKANLALSRIRVELIDVKSIDSINEDKIQYTNSYGTYELQKIGKIVTLEKKGTNPIPAKILIDNLATSYGTDAFLVFEKASSAAWSASDDISELFAITILLKFDNYSGVIQTSINPRNNNLRNAPRLI